MEKSRTPLTLQTQRTLIGNIAKGVPDDLLEQDGQYWDRNISELHNQMRLLLKHSEQKKPMPLWQIAKIDIAPEDDLSSFLEGRKNLSLAKNAAEPDGLACLVHVTLPYGDEYVQGEILIDQGKLPEDCAGLRTAIALLRQQERIPTEWEEKDKRLLFPGTVLINEEDDRLIPVLHRERSYEIERWCFHWAFFEHRAFYLNQDFIVRRLNTGT